MCERMGLPGHASATDVLHAMAARLEALERERRAMPPDEEQRLWERGVPILLDDAPPAMGMD